MSLLTNPPHVVWVQKYAESTNEDGLSRYVKQGDPIRVPCYVQDARSWSDAEEYPMNGLQMKNLHMIYARYWPGDIHSHVFFDGGEYLTEGQVGWSPTVKHARRRLNRVAHYRATIYWFGKDEQGISLRD